MKPLANWNGTLQEEPDYYGSSSFCSDLIAQFPELMQHQTKDSGLHVFLGHLAAAGRSAIGSENIAFLKRLFNFLEGVLSRPKLNSEIENALVISFLLPEDFQRSQMGRQMWATLPERLKHVLQQAV